MTSLFSHAKFILTIRDPYSWLESFFNHQLGRQVSDRWSRLRELRFRHAVFEEHPKEEALLKRRGLYTLDGYLSYWRAHNEKVLSTVPRDRLLVVRTDDLSQRLTEIAQFIGLKDCAADIERAHANQAPTKYHFSRNSTPTTSAAQCAWCEPLLQRFFPELGGGRPHLQSGEAIEKGSGNGSSRRSQPAQAPQRVAGGPDVTFLRLWGNIGDELIYAGTRQLLANVRFKERASSISDDSRAHCVARRRRVVGGYRHAPSCWRSPPSSSHKSSSRHRRSTSRSNRCGTYSRGLRRWSC